LFDTQLRAVVEREKAVEAEKQRADGAEAELAVRDAAGTLLSSLLLLFPLGLVAGLVETIERSNCNDQSSDRSIA
jgi:hypothetical protein